VIVSSTGDVELYDLEADPRETHNLADGEREKDLLRRLRAELASVEPPARDPEHPPMSARSRERLRALGYLE